MTQELPAAAEIVISVQCSASMHLHCNDKKCGCTVCHHTCYACNESCRAIHEVPAHESILPQLAGKKVCAKCYLAITVDVPKGQGCEGCGAPHGYRSPRDPGGLYLCVECRTVSSVRQEPS